MKSIKLQGVCLAALLSLGVLAGCGKGSAKDEYDEKGRLILHIKNAYFENWEGEDTYTEILNEKFQVNIQAVGYDYTDWDGAVNREMNADNLADNAHFNLKAYNYGSTYEKWVSELGMIKALPKKMSKWPNLNQMIENATNIDALKIDGRLYAIPVMNDISNPGKDFSNFTYMYRRDVAKAIDAANAGKPNWTPVYKEGDVYTWEEFNRLMDAFYTNLPNTKSSVLVDESWGFPSITNFYKDAPHCYTKDASGRAINAFTGDKYIAGLEVAKQLVTKKYYSQDQFNFKEGDAKKKYMSDNAFILYDNYSLANYIKARKEFKQTHKDVNLDDGTALLKIKGPDNKFSLEGIENWFGVTMFNVDISDKKMEKILDILEYLLTEEGTRLAVFGKEGYDYDIVDGQVVLSPQGWEKGSDGNYGPKVNGAKYVRYLATLGNDTKPIDPYTEADQEAYDIVTNWVNEMKTAKDNGSLRIFKTPGDIEWMSTETKNDKTEANLNDANVFAAQYCYDTIKNINDYKDKFNTNSWNKILKEINDKLGK